MLQDVVVAAISADFHLSRSEYGHALEVMPFKSLGSEARHTRPVVTSQLM